jgi:hypothetical protein
MPGLARGWRPRPDRRPGRRGGDGRPRWIAVVAALAVVLALAAPSLARPAAAEKHPAPVPRRRRRRSRRTTRSSRSPGRRSAARPARASSWRWSTRPGPRWAAMRPCPSCGSAASAAPPGRCTSSSASARRLGRNRARSRPAGARRPSSPSWPSGCEPTRSWCRPRRGPFTVGYAELVTITFQLLYSPIWTDLGVLLQDLHAATEPVAAARILARARTADAPGLAPMDESQVAIICADTDTPDDPRAWPSIARRADRRSPYFESLLTYLSQQPCASWRTRDPDRSWGRGMPGRARRR